MKKLAAGILLSLALVVPASAHWSISALSGTDDNVAGAIGKVSADGKSEFGFSFLTTDKGDEDYRTAFGFYGAMKFDVPGLGKLVPTTDFETFAGGAALYDADDSKLIVIPFVGIALYPENNISPIALYRYQIFDGSLSAPEYVEGSTAFFGLRIFTH